MFWLQYTILTGYMLNLLRKERLLCQAKQISQTQRSCADPNRFYPLPVDYLWGQGFCFIIENMGQGTFQLHSQDFYIDAIYTR